MTTNVITDLLKSSYVSFKEAAVLPEWVLPSRSFAEVTTELGDQAILKLTRPLKLSPDLMSQITPIAAPDSAYQESFRKAAQNWPLISRVKPVIEACLGAQVIVAKYREGGLKPAFNVCRALSVLAVAALSPHADSILADLASILGGDKDNPGDLIGRYVDAVLGNDSATLRLIDECVAGYPEWVEWSNLFEKTVLGMKTDPRLVTVTPPISADIVWVLAQMLKEAYQDESGGDHPGCPSG
jgi:hypothetical protein